MIWSNGWLASSFCTEDIDYRSTAARNGQEIFGAASRMVCSDCSILILKITQTSQRSLRSDRASFTTRIVRIPKQSKPKTNIAICTAGERHVRHRNHLVGKHSHNDIPDPMISARKSLRCPFAVKTMSPASILTTISEPDDKSTQLIKKSTHQQTHIRFSPQHHHLLNS